MCKTGRDVIQQETSGGHYLSRIGSDGYVNHPCVCCHTVGNTTTGTKASSLYQHSMLNAYLIISFNLIK